MDELMFNYATKEYVQARIVEAMHSASGSTPVSNLPSDMSVSVSEITPTETVGLSNTGGIPSLITYILNLLPADCLFARVRYKSGTLTAYQLSCIALCPILINTSTETTHSYLVRFNSSFEKAQLNLYGINIASYSATLVQGNTYYLEIFTGSMMD